MLKPDDFLQANVEWPDEQSPATEQPLPWSDYRNAIELVKQHGAEIRYCYGWKSWLVWTGTHWQRDTNGAIMRKAKHTIRHLASSIPSHIIEDDDPEDKKLKKYLAHIKKSLGTPGLKAMVECAQSEPGIPIQPEDLDTDLWLLNCANGTLDLKTGILLPHCRDDLISKCLPIDYDPDAQCPEWKKFLWTIMGGVERELATENMSDGERKERQIQEAPTEKLLTFLQRAIGYSLTGDTSEQCLFLLHGAGANGKSTFMSVLLKLLDTYGKQAEFSTFLHRKDDTAVRNDVADLRGTRLVSAIEVAEGKRLAESLVKSVTGQDPLKARFLYEEFFEFIPQFKLFLAANHKPLIQGTDHAIWRRIRLIPFNVTIPDEQQDKNLLQKLVQELPGILTWAVQGCLDWQHKKDGLAVPEAVLNATKAYRAEMDALEEFLEEHCERHPENQIYKKVKTTTLYQAYHSWTRDTKKDPLPSREFTKRLKEKGFTPDKGHAGSLFWQCLTLNEPIVKEKKRTDTGDNDDDTLPDDLPF